MVLLFLCKLSSIKLYSEDCFLVMMLLIEDVSESDTFTSHIFSCILRSLKVITLLFFSLMILIYELTPC